MGKINDLRTCLESLNGEEETVTISDEVDAKWELAAIANKLDGGPTVLFRHVKGYDMPVMTGLCSNKERVAKIFNVKWEDFPLLIIKGIKDPLPTELVKEGEVKEIKQTSQIDLLKLFPIPWHGLKDGGHYITAGVVCAKDPLEGLRNISIHRLQVTGPDTLAICISPGRHLEEFWRRANEIGIPLEIAIAIGVDPSILFAAGSSGPSIPLGFDELGLAGSLRGEPVEVVKGETVNVEVPAHTEIVIEGEILPKVRGKEGPFMDFLGLYTTANSPRIKVRAVTHRKDPIFQTIAGIKDHLMYGMPMQENSLRSLVRSVVPTLKAVNLTPGSRGLHCILSIRKTVEGQQRDAMLAALTAIRVLKWVTVVDEDIDIFNPEDVDWAIATRFQGHADLFTIPGALGERADPSSKEGICTKVCIDATAPLQGKEKFEKVEFKEVDLQKYALKKGIQKD